MPGRDPCQTLSELLATMHTLRAPGGCPWDAEQTPESLAPYLLEEVCESIEAIETGSPARIADELGDLLLQVVFQAEIFAERGTFDFADVAAGINAKLIRRHPHVFVENVVNVTAEELAAQWERIKREEQPVHPLSPVHPLGQLPGNLPALQRAQKLMARAMRSDLDREPPFPQLPAGEKLTEEQLGNALLLLVKQAELSDLDAEQVLRKVVRKILAATTTNPVQCAQQKISENQ
ncbi:MAG: nucleoside triphosphate pyrophosphohydrolase [Desulfuromonas sp.]|nr:nucleoside triphosphate pyrophosphohydrolase [Desulfuromonas sp.]